MSKHAVEAFADSLATEVEPLGGQVSAIEPADFNTEIARNAVKRIGMHHQGCRILRYTGNLTKVATASELAPNAAIWTFRISMKPGKTIGKQIEQAVKLNERHRFTYDMNALIQILDERLSQLNSR